MLQKICIITGSRAEYGLLKNLIIALRSLYDTKLIVTGSHLSSYHGMTYNMIEEDGPACYCGKSGCAEKVISGFLLGVGLVIRTIVVNIGDKLKK